MINTDDFQRVKKEYEKWWNKEQKKPLFQIVCPLQDEGKGKEKPAFRWWEIVDYAHSPETHIRLFEQWAKSRKFMAEAYPNLWINMGAGSLAAYLTGYLTSTGGTIWFEYPMDWDDVFKHLKLEETNKWWAYTKELTRLAAENCKGKFAVGITDLGGILDILASLRGTENLLYDVIDNPDKVNDAQDRILELWFKAYDELYEITSRHFEGTSAWMGIWCPKRHAPLQCDFSAMISPAMFEKFVAPYLQKQADRLDHSIYHLDGSGEIPHLDIILDIRGIDAIQWVPEPFVSALDDRFTEMYRKIKSKGKMLVLQQDVRAKEVPEFFNRVSPEGVVLSVRCENEKEAYELLEWREKLRV